MAGSGLKQQLALNIEPRKLCYCGGIRYKSLSGPKVTLDLTVVHSMSEMRVWLSNLQRRFPNNEQHGHPSKLSLQACRPCFQTFYCGLFHRRESYTFANNQRPDTPIESYVQRFSTPHDGGLKERQEHLR